MKRKNIKYLFGAFLIAFASTSCEDKLNFNENPNQATQADVELVLPQAITASASVSNQFNSYGAHFGGYMANAGGFSGFGNLLNYNLTPNDWNALWVVTYQDPLNDLKYVIDNTAEDEAQVYFHAAAEIMTVVNYQRLVDAFGNIPYSEALRADEGIVTPAYDDAATIYQDLFARLDAAIAEIQSGLDGAVLAQPVSAAADPLFDGDMEAWQKYANTLKLRILIRLSSKAEFAAFVSSGFAGLNTTLGFLEDDAIVDPGYELNRPNPSWSTWGKTPADALANSSRIPTTFAFAFYNGVKLSDAARGEASFVNFPTSPNNQLGNEDGAPTIVSGNVTWASNSVPGVGILKGPAMGQPLMLKAEAMFLIAEAILKGYMGAVNITDTDGNVVSVDDEGAFNEGIIASMAYLYKDQGENVTADPVALFTAYQDANDASDLVVYDLADTQEEKLEAIITQKYIAVNMINSDEGWNEYRRTGFPVTVPGGAPALDIASNKSNAQARLDRLPTRILYPSTEQSYNSSNYVTVNHVGDLIFWDPN